MHMASTQQLNAIDLRTQASAVQTQSQSLGIHRCFNLLRCHVTLRPQKDLAGPLLALVEVEVVVVVEALPGGVMWRGKRERISKALKL